MNPRQETTHRILLAFVLILAVSLRLLWLKAVPTQPVTDFDWYFERARDIANGRGFSVNGVPTAYWPPGYSYFLAPFLKLVSGSVTVAKSLNLLLTTTIVLQTYLLSRRLHDNPITALVASLITAILLPLVAYSSILASEPLYTVLSLAGCIAAFNKDQQPKNAVLAGLAFGAATLVRPQAVIFPLLVYPIRALFDRSAPRADHACIEKNLKPLHAAALAFLAIFAINVPWAIRNAKLFQSPILVSTNGGDNLWIGHNPSTTGKYMDPGGRPAAPQIELANDRAQRQRALEYITSNPGTILAKAPEKLSATFTESRDVPYWAFQKTKGKLTQPGTGSDKQFYKWTQNQADVHRSVLNIASLIGLATALLAKSTRRAILLPVAMIGYTALLSIVFFGNPRFGFPALPFQALLVGLLPAALLSFLNKNPSNTEHREPNPDELKSGDFPQP